MEQASPVKQIFTTVIHVWVLSSEADAIYHFQNQSIYRIYFVRDKYVYWIFPVYLIFVEDTIIPPRIPG